MAATPGWTRIVVLLWAALQLALPPVLTVMDANLATAVAGTVGAHVESTSTPDCHRAHGADCAFCQFLSTYLGTVRAASPARIVALAQVRPSALLPTFGASAARSLPGSRAPPLG
jgi:hypothetical protein